MSAENFAKMLKGVLDSPMVLKARYESHVKKLQLHQGQSFGFYELVKEMKGMFMITSNEPMSLKYRDEDGDFITLADDDDLTLAMRTGKHLYVEVSVQKKDYKEVLLFAAIFTFLVTSMINCYIAVYGFNHPPTSVFRCV